MTNQILTLVAVLIGALASFLSTSWLNRSEQRNDLDRSWRFTRLESYRNYLRDAKTLEAAHILNRDLWRLDWFARGQLDDNDRPGWQDAMRRYMVAIDTFNEAARRDMGVPGTYSRREPEIPPNVLYEQERRNS